MTDKLDNPLDNDAARLYAENLPVVHAMRDEFVRAIEGFFDAVLTAAANSFQEVDIRERVSSGKETGNRSWWLGSVGSDRSEQPYLWFNTRDPEILLNSRVPVFVFHDAASPEQQAELAEVLRKEEIPGEAKMLSGGSSSHPKFVLDWTGSDEPVESCAGMFQAVLRALFASWRRVLEEAP